MSGLRLLYTGAEADILAGRWCGLGAIYKVRRPFPYRLKVLDDAIREQRTIHEAQLMHEAKTSGVKTPYVYYVDTAHTTIVMQHMEGSPLKQEVASLTAEQKTKTFTKLGAEVAKLHLSGLMHGDLTTSNVLINEADLALIDFGLALRTTRLEDRAVDLRVMKETLTGGHSNAAYLAFDSVLRGYEGEAGEEGMRKVKRQLAAIERRGRYTKVD